MAINLKDFKATKYPNLFKSHTKDKLKGYKYLMWVKIDGKLYKKIIGYSETDKLTDSKANSKLDSIKRDIQDGYTSTDRITLNKLFELYCKTLDQNKRWYYDLNGIYDRYIKHNPLSNGQSQNKGRKESLIGNKELSKIREMDIKSIISNMNKKGYSPRTQKSILEVLNPLFKFAVKNRYLKENPAQYLSVKIPNQKKPVTNATELMKKVYDGITTYYKDNPYYKALFLFGFSGRRKSEILSLKWENIDFVSNYYWIEDTKNGSMQKYDLPKFIIDPLLNINDDRKGLVFKSPVTGNKLTDINRQMNHLKKHTGIENLSLHYMRNILVSALAEQGTEAIVLSGILGHSDANTIKKYLSINHHKSSLEGNKKLDEVIDIEVIE